MNIVQDPAYYDHVSPGLGVDFFYYRFSSAEDPEQGHDAGPRTTARGLCLSKMIMVKNEHLREPWPCAGSLLKSNDHGEE